MGQLGNLARHINRFVSALDDHLAADRRVIVSSSFQTQSMPLLHLVAEYGPSLPIYFVDTGFHLPETLSFRDEVCKRLGLQVVNVSSPVPLSDQRDSAGDFLWVQNTDGCCRINKTMPLEPVLAEADVWITGVRRDQSPTRASFKFESPGPFGVTRIHPMLEWTKQDVWSWVKAHDLPRHPLELQGYDSISCGPCTAKPSLDGERSGRWDGLNKTECGLHTVLATESR